jgi:hypothetical protein
MRTQQSKQYEAWRCRREQYLRESGRHVELIKEGYASGDSTKEWTVVVGGSGRGPLKPGSGTRVFLVGRRVSTFVLGAKKAVDRQPEDTAPQKGGRRGGR